ncbi:MAG: SusF/SusE family outer membrane protein [Muribaculaceae bacterium]|nr:SusF/SusE family outer membrane protein [Muribaculaceae bacterium]
MKNIIKTSLLLLCGLVLTTACNDDNDSNPIYQQPKEFVLNTPAMATSTIDLANSENLVLYCTQPNYGFTARTIYSVQVASLEDKSDAVDLKGTYDQARIEVSPATLASTLTSMMLEKGKTEDNFPMNLPVFLRVKAYAANSAGTMIEGSEIYSNWVTLHDVHLLFSLAPVTTPEALCVAGTFNGGSWDTALDMVQVYDAANIFWHLVFIDDKGIQLNQEHTAGDFVVGYDQITIAGDLGDDIVNADGKIASKNPGWYLVIVTTSVTGRKINYDVQFNRPEVYMMGPITPLGAWSELEEGTMFTVPTEADADFVSPPFAASVPGGDGDGVRAYVKVPGYDWWKSEFMVYGAADSEGYQPLEYRGMGGDQNASEADGGFGYRVKGNEGQKMYFNFTKEKGKIE